MSFGLYDEARQRDEKHKRQRALINLASDWAEKYAGKDADAVRKGQAASLSAGERYYAYLMSCLMETATVWEALGFLRSYHRHSALRIHRRQIAIYFGRFAQYVKATKRLKGES